MIFFTQHGEHPTSRWQPLTKKFAALEPKRHREESLLRLHRNSVSSAVGVLTRWYM